MDKKILLILGGSSDLAVQFINREHLAFDKIIAHYNRNSNDLLKLKSTLGDKLTVIQSNFSSKESIDDFLSALTANDIFPTHILHCPALSVKYERFGKNKTSWDYVQKAIDIQLRSAYLILSELLLRMAKNKCGKVVFVLSSCVAGNPPASMVDYVVVKYAMLGFMKALAAEYATKNIQINAVSPSMMETKFLSELSNIVIEANAQANPQKRNATVDDCIPALSLLLSDDSAFITGQNIVISGGSVL